MNSNDDKQPRPEALIPSAVDLAPYLSANCAGEMLRELSFTSEGYGAYSNFNLRAGFTPKNPATLRLTERTALLGCFANNLSEVERITAFQREDCRLMVAWHWDGDGTLIFSSAGWLLDNTDCKKSHGWEWNAQWIGECVADPSYYCDPPRQPTASPTDAPTTTGATHD